MEHFKQRQVSEVQERLDIESDRYTVAIQEGNFIDAKAIQYYMNQLQKKIDELLPFARQC